MDFRVWSLSRNKCSSLLTREDRKLLMRLWWARRKDRRKLFFNKVKMTLTPSMNTRKHAGLIGRCGNGRTGAVEAGTHSSAPAFDLFQHLKI